MPDRNLSNGPLLYAHRGTSLLAPENTSAAFDMAAQYQCDVLEIDVRLSRDNQVIVTHDATLSRTTDGDGLVRSQKLRDLKKLDAGCRFSASNKEPYNGEKLSLLTLDELFQQYPKIGVNIDIKDNDDIAAESVSRVLDRYAEGRWVNVGSFHAQVMQRFRSCMPDVSTSATRQEVARLFFTGVRTTPEYSLLQIPTSYWGLRLDTQRFIQKIHRTGINVVYWTINEPVKMRDLLMKGCDGLVTDRPDLALAEFQRLGFKQSMLC